MTTFVDTSALYALVAEDDEGHEPAVNWLAGPGADPREILITHSYVIVESAALVHRRLGPAALRALLDGLVPALSVLYVDEPLHLAATHAFVAAAERKISLVDWVSFQMMRDEGIDLAFAFDRDFKLQGFQTVP